MRWVLGRPIFALEPPLERSWEEIKTPHNPPAGEALHTTGPIFSRLSVSSSCYQPNLCECEFSGGGRRGGICALASYGPRPRRFRESAPRSPLGSRSAAQRG